MHHRFYDQYFPRCIPTRVLIGLMMFTCCWTSYMVRLQMPILAVPMVAQTEKEKGKKGACDDGSKDSKTHRRKRTVWFDPNDPWMEEEAEYNHRILPLSANSSEDLIRLQESVRNLTLAQMEYDEHPGSDRLFKHRKRRQAEDRAFALFSNEPFNWSPTVRGTLISAYSWGNAPGNLIGGIMALKWGARQSVLWTSLAACFVSFLTPLLSQTHWGVLVFSRVIIGLTGGITFPACHALVAKWSPPDEKSRFVWTLQGGTFGTIFTYPLISSIAEHVTWESAWYIPSLMMLVWIVFWVLIAYDSPDEHPGISNEEKDYIITSQAGTVRKKNPSLGETPVCKILTSIPFITLVICHFGNMFLLFLYQNSMMIYLSKALGFQLSKGGALASLPWAGRMAFAYFFSWAGDTIKKKQLVSVTWLRKTATIFSHLIPGILLVAVGYVECQLILAQVFLFFALAFNGAAAIANLSNNQDLSPNFAGFLYGIMNTIGGTSGIMIPYIVEEIAGKNGNAIDKWQIIFWIGAVVCIASMLIFFIGGSGNIQSWNELPEAKPDEATVEDAEGASKPPGPAPAPTA